MEVAKAGKGGKTPTEKQAAKKAGKPKGAKEKKEKELKAKAVKAEIKEIRFGPNTDDHDFDFKLNHAKNFLQEGSKVRAYVFFKGRSVVFCLSL